MSKPNFSLGINSHVENSAVNEYSSDKTQLTDREVDIYVEKRNLIGMSASFSSWFSAASFRTGELPLPFHSRDSRGGRRADWAWIHDQIQKLYRAAFKATAVRLLLIWRLKRKNSREKEKDKNQMLPIHFQGKTEWNGPRIFFWGEGGGGSPSLPSEFTSHRLDE